jgi:hypothetical protein
MLQPTSFLRTAACFVGCTARTSHRYGSNIAYIKFIQDNLSKFFPLALSAGALVADFGQTNHRLYFEFVFSPLFFGAGVFFGHQIHHA